MPPETFLYRLWAKTNERDDGATPETWARHPLPCHLFDVGLVAEAWLDADERLMGRFADLWPEADPKDLRRALILTAAVHDLGKVYPDFQAKSEQGWAHGYGTVWSGERPTGRGFDHGAGTARIFNALLTGRYGPAEGVDPAWKTLGALIRVGAGHHGTLYPDEALRADADARNHPTWSPLVRAALGEVVHAFGPVPTLPLHPPPALLMLTAGFVSVADWFGSNTDSFPAAPDVTSRADADVYLARHRESRTAERALRDAGLIAETRAPETFEDLFEGWSPREGFQAAACAVPFGRTPGREIAVVEAPMGLGKTEIALWLAAQALRHGTAAGLYAALPTQATANALFGRVRRFADRVRADDDDLALVLAHGASRYYPEYRALRDETFKRTRRRTPFDETRRADPRDDTPPSETVAPSWVQPSKRALLAPVGLGTIDQALLGAMGVRHGFVRLFGLAGKVVVLDEVHAYDVYMGALLEHLLAWLGALGCKVVLLSATLPAGLRSRLLTAYGAAEPPASDAYPQLLHGIGRAPVTVLEDPAPETAKRTVVHVESVVGAGDAEARTAAGVAWVAGKVEQGGCVAWIRNTVREAQDAARELRRAGVETDLLHARFVRADRNAKEDALLERFGPPAPDTAAGDGAANPKRPARRAVVATQVIEQSVDVDFDAMLSDLAPVDLLLQRAGRLHRHDRTGQRHGHDDATLGVLLPDAESRHRLDFGTSVYVYDADTLARSAVLVEENPQWMLPEACRTLVAALYDGGPDAWPADRLGVDPAALDTARARLAARRDTMTRTALRTLLTPPDLPPVMRDARRDRSDGGEFVALTTRYGAHSAAAVLFRDTPDGPVPVGSERPLAVPPERDWSARLDAEEALALASVSFPWYGPRPDDSDPPEALAPIARWWRETHPYDARLFLLLGSDGEFATPSVTGRYDADLGLTVARTPATPAATDSVPLDSL